MMTVLLEYFNLAMTCCHVLQVTVTVIQLLQYSSVALKISQIMHYFIKS